MAPVHLCFFMVKAKRKKDENNRSFKDEFQLKKKLIFNYLQTQCIKQAAHEKKTKQNGNSCNEMYFLHNEVPIFFMFTVIKQMQTPNKL